MNASTMKQLQKISTPKQFAKDEYICYEGQPGNEMYIILKGVVGVYLTSAIGTLTEVAMLQQGDFFGEMAIFDNLPRSASCIAQEDTVCVAIDKSNLIAFLTSCPDMTEKILERLSTRIRKLNNDLYKNPHLVKEQKMPRFEVPKEYGFSHVVKEPYQEPRVLMKYTQNCPICGESVKIVDLKRNIMTIKKVNKDCRMVYLMCEPLWYDVVACPHCYYANHRLQFSKVNTADSEKIKKVLKEQYAPIMEEPDKKRTAFDELVLKYLRALHLNEHINPDDNALLCTLWLKLYWLANDSGDEKFVSYCASKATERLKAAIDGKEISDKVSECSLALSLANLLVRNGRKDEAAKYSTLAVTCPDEKIRSCAESFQADLG